MRFTLPESSPLRQRSTMGTMASAAIHAVLIGGTLAATAMPAERRRVDPTPPEKLIFVKAREDEGRPAVRTRLATIAPALSHARPPHSAHPRRTGRRRRPDHRPDRHSRRRCDPRGGLRQCGGARVASAGEGVSAGGSPGGDGSAPLSAATVDRAVVLRAVVVPRYPAVLASAGVEGTVLAEFVVDTLGRVERETIVMLRSDHRQFDLSVRDALARMRFVPAEVQGRKVRQLVQQPFSFALTRE
jgi:periplasmic protein TonB